MDTFSTFKMASQLPHIQLHLTSVYLRQLVKTFLNSRLFWNRQCITEWCIEKGWPMAMLNDGISYRSLLTGLVNADSYSPLGNVLCYIISQGTSTPTQGTVYNLHHPLLLHACAHAWQRRRIWVWLSPKIPTTSSLFPTEISVQKLKPWKGGQFCLFYSPAA
jgi:hypothetical protein